jgi:hypothetical protein
VVLAVRMERVILPDVPPPCPDRRSFPDFFCVKRPEGGSGCPNGKVDSSGRPSSLSGQACFCDLLHGTTSGRHLSSVRTVNPIGLSHSPHATTLLFHLFGPFFRLVRFSVLFMRISQVHVSSFQFMSTQVCFYTLLLIYFNFLCLK